MVAVGAVVAAAALGQQHHDSGYHPRRHGREEGDIVIGLDSSSLTLEGDSQKIQVNRESLLAPGECLKAAEIGIEYLEGLYVSQESPS